MHASAPRTTGRKEVPSDQRFPAFGAFRVTIVWMRMTIRALLLMWSVLPASAQVPASEAEVPRITNAEFEKARGAGLVLVIDVRDDAAYQAGHIASAISIPESAIPKHVEKLKAEKRTIVTYCA